MPWAIQYQTLPFNEEWSCSFNFPESVSSYIVGIPYFHLSYDITESIYQVQALGLSLGTTQQGQTVSVTVTPTLSDAGGHTIDNQNSSVMVAVIAWTGAANPQVMLGSAPGIADGGSAPLPVPSNTSNTGLQPILSGFDLEYASGSYQVETVDVSVSASPQGQGTASVNATVRMHDAGGHYADRGNGTATIDGALLATSLSSPGYVTQTLQLQSGHPVCVNFGNQLSSAVALITGFKVQYQAETSHLLKWISAGTASWSLNGPTVVLNSPRAQLYDTVNSQDNTQSNVSLVVVGIPSS
jgi:hypothetical protein